MSRAELHPQPCARFFHFETGSRIPAGFELGTLPPRPPRQLGFPRLSFQRHHHRIQTPPRRTLSRLPVPVDTPSPDGPTPGCRELCVSELLSTPETVPSRWRCPAGGQDGVPESGPSPCLAPAPLSPALTTGPGCDPWLSLNGQISYRLTL